MDSGRAANTDCLAGTVECIDEVSCHLFHPGAIKVHRDSTRTRYWRWYPMVAAEPVPESSTWIVNTSENAWDSVRFATFRHGGILTRGKDLLGAILLACDSRLRWGLHTGRR